MSNATLAAFVWKFIRPQAWKFFVILIVSLVWSLDATLWPWLLKQFVDIFTDYEESRNQAWQALKTPILGALVLWSCVELGFRLQGFLLAKALPQLEADIRMAMFNHIQRHSPRYFNEHFAGSLANKITDMTTHVSNIIGEILSIFIPATATCLISLILFSRINGLFAALLAFWLIVHFTLCILFSRRCAHKEGYHAEVRSTLLGKIVDSFTNNVAVNLFYRFKEEDAFLAPFQNEETKTNRAAKYSIERMRLWLSLLTFMGGNLSINGLLIYLWLQDQISTGTAVQIFNTTWNIIQVIWIVGFSLPGLFQSIGIASQAFSLLKDPQDIVDAPNAKALTVTKGKISFENVSFHYGQKRLFENKNIVIEGGEKVGLVGYSGSGKSTFVNLILRFFPIRSGRILIDGQDLSTMTFASLRRQVALIPQDPVLFHRSLKDNILYGRPDATDEELSEAVRLAHCEEFIGRLPLGWHTMVGERGSKLSGGERQRIAIARAILANAPILILDEATSALDSVTEQYIQESLEWLMQGRTTLVIAHRLSTLAGMDRILVFDAGKIVEQGTHADLISEEGHYARMWSMQAGGFLGDEWEDAEEED